jgi:hypothetical protein
MLHTEENKGTRTRGSQKRHVSFLDQTYFIAFSIQQTNNDLPCNRRFSFQDNAVKVNLFSLLALF